MSKQEQKSSYLKLTELLTTSLQLNEQKFTIMECPAKVFDAFMQQVVRNIVNVNRQKWEPYEKWRIINRYLEKGLLHLTSGPDGQLLEVADMEVEPEVSDEQASEEVGA